MKIRSLLLPLLLLTGISTATASEPAPPASCGKKPQVIKEATPAESQKFRNWLLAQNDEELKKMAQSTTGLYRTDLDQDGKLEVISTDHQGAGGFLVLEFFKEATDGYTDLAFDYEDPENIGGNEYLNRATNSRELLMRICDRVYLTLDGSVEGSRYGYLVRDGKFRRACDPAFTDAQLGMTKALSEKRLYPFAENLLTDYQKMCGVKLVSEDRMRVFNELSLMAHRQGDRARCLQQIAEAKKEGAFGSSPARSAVLQNEILCKSEKPLASLTASDFYWVESTKDGNAAVWDDRFELLLNVTVPTFKYSRERLDSRARLWMENQGPDATPSVKEEPPLVDLRGDVRKNLRGPETKKRMRGGVVQITGCREQSCGDKSALWVLASRSQSLFGITGFKLPGSKQTCIALGSRTLGVSDLSATWMPKVLQWKKDSALTENCILFFDGKQEKPLITILQES